MSLVIKKKSWLENLPICASNNTFKRHVGLLLLEEEDQFHYALIKDFSTFMYNQTLHQDRKVSCCYCIQFFSTTQRLERQFNNCFEINDKQMIKMIKKGEPLNSKTIQKR